MSRFLPEGHRTSSLNQVIGLTARGAAWLETDTDGQLTWQSMTWPTNSLVSNAQAAINSVTAKLGTSAKGTITWVLSPGLAPSWIQHPSPQIASLKELHAVAQARASLLFGESISPMTTNALWDINGDWHPCRPFLCVAIPSNLRSLLLEARNKSNQGGKLSMIAHPLTLALTCFRKKLPKNGWLALAMPGVLHITHLSCGRITRLRNLQLPAGSSPTSVENMAILEWQREMLRSQLSSDHLSWLNLVTNASPATHAPLLRPITWTSRRRMPGRLLPCTSLKSSDDHITLDDALQMAWSAQLLLAEVVL